MKYWDASALLQVMVDQGGSEWARGVLRDDPVVATSWLTRVECWSAFARLRRQGQLSPPEEEAARADLLDLYKLAFEVEFTEEIRQSAGRLLRVHPLRASDALHLACALAWAQGEPGSCDFVSLDARLSRAARLEGFQVIPREMPSA